jgi:hypothetical protein
MSAVSTAAARSGWRAVVRHQGVVLGVFTATIFLSALLLFSVQPMFARMVLPKLGGSPSVWAVSTCFFQAALLAGYLYAHVLNRRLGAGTALLVHLTVLAVAALALPIGLPAAAEPPAGDAYLWLVGILAVGVGLPFFAVSANSPLLQAWFARSGHPQAEDPYFLYGASNVGSLLALLAYPIVIEPMLGLSIQGSVWTGGFALLAALIAGCGALMLANMPSHAAARADRSVSAPPVLAAKLMWIGLAFVPSALLVAFTTYVTTDIASAPFLWVLPLAIFLATFIVVFRDRPLIPHAALVSRLPMVVAAALFGMVAGDLIGAWFAGAASFVAFVVASLVCHRELYERRPAAEHLTGFYLWMSLGGVLGGIFAALLAPQLFTSIFEFPLLLAIAILCRPQILDAGMSRTTWGEALRILAIGAAALFLCEVLARLGLTQAGGVLKPLLLGVLFAAVLLAHARPHVQVALVALMGLAQVLPTDAQSARHEVRSFFGLHRVLDNSAGDMRILVHGTTVHGAQRLKSADGKPLDQATPASYYHADGPMRRGLTLARGPEGRPVRGGVVGLGAGSFACYRQPGDSWTYYEIDPAVVAIARDPKLFGFLSQCNPSARIVLGDARLTVAKEPQAAFDYLLIDAFSSDAIPVHLLTAEALQLYLSKLAPDGLVALHVSNRHLDLPPIVAATMAGIPGLKGVVVHNIQSRASLDAASSVVVYLSRDEALLERALTYPDTKHLETRPGVAAWTDDYSDILTALLRARLK